MLEHRYRRVEARLAVLDRTPSPEVAATAARVTVISEFVLSVLLRQTEQLLERLDDVSALSRDAVLSTIDIARMSESNATAVLRRCRNVELARLAWRDLAGWSTFEESVRDLSTLADVMIEAALGYAADSLKPRFGRPVDGDGKAGALLVLAMGKLGGKELNFSSDIDLVFLYPDGLVLNGAKAVEPEEYFRRLVQLVIKLLDHVTEDGFVFRVDVRLRPFGASGPLVVSVPALESYLARHGRDWERYAYVKARLITGRDHRSELFDEILSPFVYRQYIDFGVFEALREMKRSFRQRVERKGIAHNIKIGPGGIREIEFIARTFQLLRGGSEPSLRTPSLLTVLPRLAEQAGYEEQVTRSLAEAYRFLRTVENRLQAMDDRQTHETPTDPEQRERLAYALGEPGWPTLAARLERHRGRVQTEFDRLTWAADSAAAERERSADTKAAWEAGTLNDALQRTPLASDPDTFDLLNDFRRSGLYRRMDEPGRQRLADVVANVVARLESQPAPGNTLRRLLPVLRAICRRSAYLSLLNENPTALERLLSLAARSALLIRQIAEYPLLLDELLDARLFDSPPTRAELSRSGRDTFDIKQDAGGLADIEFLIDYWVPANSREYPELVEFPDNVRQLEALERTGLVDAGRCHALKVGYLELRQRTHELALNDAGRVVVASEFRELRDWIVSIWDEVFAS
ncbi:bifunctional [glutamate--ammonia ligase]-adenylyl-L-tyrosine phosphorylase/[glutamate--ammonia-ligase] adenylyltransferase [Candidatus Rariloculus sp.]|uniref:bifunctional [glutamate--ammonia ligase]-adenylyl-L-tyrosine phosphorylase/[glutamate--ammonia-ligase] adenylyltransferase n=1 Tax=Candidatus Rariloculus sp. TaxID=3101265 RepID=UPI003D097B27